VADLLSATSYFNEDLVKAFWNAKNTNIL